MPPLRGIRSRGPDSHWRAAPTVDPDLCYYPGWAGSERILGAGLHGFERRSILVVRIL
jgi:hypothetical protein